MGERTGTVKGLMWVSGARQRRTAVTAATAVTAWGDVVFRRPAPAAVAGEEAVGLHLVYTWFTPGYA